MAVLGQFCAEVIGWCLYPSEESRGGVGGLSLSPPLFLDQTEDQKAEKIFLGTSPPSPPLSQGLDDRSPLSEGLDGHCTTGGDFMQSWH